MFHAKFRTMELVCEDGACGVNGRVRSCVERPADREAYGRCPYNFPRFRDPRMIWVTV